MFKFAVLEVSGNVYERADVLLPVKVDFVRDICYVRAIDSDVWASLDFVRVGIWIYWGWIDSV